MPVQAELQRRYRQAIGRFAAAVTVITTEDSGRLGEMTASAVASLSLEPPMLLVCVNDHVPTHSALEQSRRFGVSVPLLDRAIAQFACEVHERLPGGDHSIFIGAIRHCEHVPGRRPLLYFASGFGGIQQVDDALGRSSEMWALAGM